MKALLSLLTFHFSLLTFPLAAQEDPQVAINAKLREALRNTTLQLRTAQAEVVTLQAEKTAAETQLSELTKKSETLAKQAAEDQTESRKKIEKLTIENDQLERRVKSLEETLAKWKEGYEKAAKVAHAKEAERAKLADEKSVLQAKVRDHKAQNLELYRLATEILDRYRKFGVGDSLKAREPFTRITRARLESQVQDYLDKIEDARMKEDNR